MRILVTGGTGMLGTDLVPVLRGAGHAVTAPDRSALDVTRPDGVLSTVEDAAPDVVVHCAAYTQVDAAEADSETAFAVNARGTESLARACDAVMARLVYVSTDYVFDGAGTRPYRPDDATAPLNVYGRSKRGGEEATLGSAAGVVVRTSWLFGHAGRNFVETVLGRAARGESLRVVDDQVGRPTSTKGLSAILLRLIEADVRGIFHASGAGEPVSWHGFAEAIATRSPYSVGIARVPSREFATPAARPTFSVLDCSATEVAIGSAIPTWESMLDRYLDDRRAPSVMEPADAGTRA